MSSPEQRADEQRQRWQTDTSSDAAWDAVRLIGDLRRGGQATEAVRLAEDALAQWPDLEALGSALGWALYARDLAGLDDRCDRAARATARDSVNRIRTLSAHAPYDTYSPWPTAVLKLAGVLDRWPTAQLGVLTQLDPAELSTEATDRFSSPRARWELAATKAMQAAGHWPQLAETCAAALAGSHLQVKERGWLLRRHAIAQEHLGELDEATATLRACVRIQPEWYLDADLARVHAAAGRIADAVDAARRALAARGAELYMRIRPVVLLAGLLDPDVGAPGDDPVAGGLTDAELADAHLQLARWLRREQGWPADVALEAQATRRSLPAPGRPDLDRLRAYWSSAPDPSREHGEIIRILPGEGSGFLRRDQGGEVYFSMGRGRTAPAVGTRVSFRVVDSFDRSKQVASHKAVELRPDPAVQPHP